jgi:hypothetical protein
MVGRLCLNPVARNSYVIIGTQEIYNYVTTVELVNCEYISKSRLKDMIKGKSQSPHRISSLLSGDPCTGKMTIGHPNLIRLVLLGWILSVTIGRIVPLQGINR